MLYMLFQSWLRTGSNPADSNRFRIHTGKVFKIRFYRSWPSNSKVFLLQWFFRIVKIKMPLSTVPRLSLKATMPLFRVKFTNWLSSPLVLHVKKKTPVPSFAYPSALIYQGIVFSLMCETSGDGGRFVNFTQKSGGVVFKDEWRRGIVILNIDKSC